MKIIMTTRITPSTNDILLGRGKTYHNHRGNQRFRAIIAVHIPKYADAQTTRKQKTRIVQSIVEDMYSDGCRFLKKDRKSTLWCDVGSNNAKKKVGHALRDATAEMNRSLKRAERIHFQERGIPISDRVSSAPQPCESQSTMDAASDPHESSTPISLCRTTSSSTSHNLKMDDDSSGDSCESDHGGLFPASEFFKYADIEPISIANIALSSQPQLSHLQGPNEDDDIDSTKDDVAEKDEADFFSSVLDMLNEASSVMKSDL